MRAIFEALDAEVTWDGATRTATAVRANTVIKLTIDSPTATIDGSSISLDVPGRIIGNRTFVPIRFVSEALGATVAWEAASRTVRITPAVAPSQSPETSPLDLLEANVVRVIDGDTAEMELESGTTEKVRFIGIDTPESTIQHEPYGEEASDYTKAQIEGKTVYLELDVEERDRYGRLLAYVWLSAPDKLTEDAIRAHQFNARLALEGYAEPMTIPPNVKYADYYAQFAREARKAEKGLWGLASE